MLDNLLFRNKDFSEKILLSKKSYTFFKGSFCFALKPGVRMNNIPLFFHMKETAWELTPEKSMKEPGENCIHKEEEKRNSTYEKDDNNGRSANFVSSWPLHTTQFCPRFLDKRARGIDSVFYPLH
jgi:hypothetical protein